MDQSECTICNETFNGECHRPRALPCGHGFCTQCIDSCISQGNKACPVCRKDHGANSASELPVSFLLEELLHKATISASQNRESDLVNETGSVSMCPKHVGIPLYFHCKKHNIKVCHSCVVIDHPASSCNLISLDEKIKEDKETYIKQAQKQIQNIMNTEKDCMLALQKNTDSLTKQENKKQDLEREVTMLLTKIEEMNSEISKQKKKQEQIQDVLHGCQNKQKVFETIEKQLRAAVNNQEIVKQYEILTTKSLQSQQWEELKRKECHISQVCRSYSKLFHTLNPVNGKITGSVARPEMEKSKLPNNVLANIWKLADIEVDGQLDVDEFELAMYFIDMKLNNQQLPSELPKHLVPPSKRGF